MGKFGVYFVVEDNNLFTSIGSGDKRYLLGCIGRGGGGAVGWEVGGIEQTRYLISERMCFVFDCGIAWAII